MNFRDKVISEMDVEATVEASHPAIRPGSSVSFAVHRGGEDRLIVVVEIERRSGQDRRARELPPADALESFWYESRAASDRRSPWPPPSRRVSDPEISAAIEGAVRAGHAIAVHETVLVSPGSLPRTADGRIDRAACHSAFAAGGMV